jgi:dipeptidyl aminopeptidase/acylaminoacyl peptidase
MFFTGLSRIFSLLRASVLGLALLCLAATSAAVVLPHASTQNAPTASAPSAPSIASSVSVGPATDLTTKQTAAKSASPAANRKIVRILEQLGRTHWPQQAAISPDGKTVAWVARQDKTGSRIHLARLEGGKDERVLTASTPSQKDCSEGSVAWSPDSQQIAFLSDCQSASQKQLFVAPADGSAAPRKLTSATGFMHQVAWSPDGQQIAFLFVENATRPAGALAAMRPAVGVISAANLAEVQRVAVVQVSSGAMRLLTPANLHVYEYDWSPDSQAFAYVAAAPPGEDNWWVAQLYTQREAQPQPQPQAILRPTMQIALPRWSPDGKEIAFIGGLMSDQGVTGGDIYRVPATGGTPQDMTPGRASTPAWIDWRSNSTLLFTEFVDGQPRIAQLDTATGAVRNLWQGEESIGSGNYELSLSVARPAAENPTTEDVATVPTALIRSSWAMPPEVWAGKIGQWRPVTHWNNGQRPDWGNAKDLIWNNEGHRVQGWLLYPKHYDPSKKYPMVVYVHGGPASAVTPRWPYAGYNGTAFSSLGYFVLFPNPRGSFGEGEAFTAANRKDFGYGDLRDILAGVDAVTKTLPVDPQRIGITGWSYGGFMSMFAVTQTQRFHAAVAGAGISDWKSYYGENSIDQWMVPYFGASVYDDPAVYAKSSAINFIHNAKTSTLIVVGDRDGECPAPQSFEFWHALRAMGTPVELVVYPNEGHGFSNPKDRRDVLERALEWFEQYMPPGQP